MYAWIYLCMYVCVLICNSLAQSVTPTWSCSLLHANRAKLIVAWLFVVYFRIITTTIHTRIHTCIEHIKKRLLLPLLHAALISLCWKKNFKLICVLLRVIVVRRSLLLINSFRFFSIYLYTYCISRKAAKHSWSASEAYLLPKAFGTALKTSRQQHAAHTRISCCILALQLYSICIQTYVFIYLYID